MNNFLNLRKYFTIAMKLKTYTKNLSLNKKIENVFNLKKKIENIFLFYFLVGWGGGEAYKSLQ